MSDLIRWIADSLGYVPREEMEARVAQIDEEMRDRLKVASDKAADKLRSVQANLSEKERRIAELEGQAASDAQSDADALSPIVEFLEQLGADEADPVPAVDPVPSEPGQVPGAPEPDVTDGALPGGVSEVPAPTEGGTVEQPSATTDAPVDPGTGEVQGGSAV
jgi:hypothetical protein